MLILKVAVLGWIFHCSVISTCVNKIKEMYERPRVNVKVEPRETFTFMRDTSDFASILFTRVNYTYLRT